MKIILLLIHLLFIRHSNGELSLQMEIEEHSNYAPVFISPQSGLNVMCGELQCQNGASCYRGECLCRFGFVGKDCSDSLSHGPCVKLATQKSFMTLYFPSGWSTSYSDLDELQKEAKTVWNPDFYLMLKVVYGNQLIPPENADSIILFHENKLTGKHFSLHLARGGKLEFRFQELHKMEPPIGQKIDNLGSKIVYWPANLTEHMTKKSLFSDKRINEYKTKALSVELGQSTQFGSFLIVNGDEFQVEKSDALQVLKNLDLKTRWIESLVEPDLSQDPLRMFGGKLPSLIFGASNENNGFTGTISDVYVNGVKRELRNQLFGDVIHGLGIESCEYDDCESYPWRPACQCAFGKTDQNCRRLIDIAMPRFSGDSFLTRRLTTLNTNWFSTQFSLIFMPTGQNGLLLYQDSDSHELGDYIAAGLSNGFFFVVFNLGSYNTLVKSV
ncbi:hypothetical protein Ciccas_008711 [Cichlidogyrus casuarinus]|uniref:EGF-like domain-containing protein n=1 Tax=Cichlidogyrus casuarinus TaxID=1844966 RepID=A0ABD2PZ77_9PLAT